MAPETISLLESENMMLMLPWFSGNLVLPDAIFPEQPSLGLFFSNAESPLA